MIRKFMDHINKDTNLIIFGVNETMNALKNNQVETLILYENLEYHVVDLIPDGKGKEDMI